MGKQACSREHSPEDPQGRSRAHSPGAGCAENAHTLDVMPPARAAVREEVKKWIRSCLADGKGD
jgi:hypothetical protein